MDSVDGGSVDGVDHRGGVDSMDSVDGGSGDVATSRGRGVLGLTGVGHLSNVAGQVVGVVGDGLDPAVGKVDGVGSSDNTGTIVGLRLLEGSLAVVISDGVGVGVGGGLGHHSMGHGVLGGGGGGGHEGKGDEGLHDVSVRSLGGLMLSPASTAPLYLTPTFAARTAKPATEHWRR